MKRSMVFKLAMVGGLVCLLAAVESARSETSNDQQLEKRAAEFRAEGADGLQAALKQLEQLSGSANTDAIEQMRRCVDLTAGQRDAWASRLFWYTDLDKAEAAAAESGKPILSLRMLGKLTDEYSCANSRFFRTTLYSNEEVSKYLRENYILHWQSVRPVPRITIDFGDGRKIERTITGNSAHYVLDASGRPLDVLPGLYSPQAFGEWLRQCVTMYGEYKGFGTQSQRDAVLVSHHTWRRAALDQRLQQDLADAAPEVLSVQPVSAASLTAASGVAAKQPSAKAAARRTVGKTAVEAPIITAIAHDVEQAQGLDADVWRRISQLPGHATKLDLASKQMMRREFPTAAVAGARAGSKLKVEDPLVRLVQTFQGSISLDQVKNEYLLHRRIHDWFAAGEPTADFDQLNERVYAELFLTPSSDPWLGLAPADAYTALDGGGLTRVNPEASQLGAAR